MRYIFLSLFILGGCAETTAEKIARIDQELIEAGHGDEIRILHAADEADLSFWTSE